MPSKRASAANGLSILVVDDEPSIVEYLEVLLRQRGHLVRSVKDGRKAADAVLSKPTHVVLLDLMMPDQHGLTTLEQLRAVSPDVGIIILTGYSETESAVAAMRMRADDYLAKPFRPDQLMDAIERIVVARNIPRTPEEAMRRRLGERVRNLRKQESLSQGDLASRANMSNAQISSIERCQTTPSLDAVFRLARVFGMTLAEFFHGV